MCKFITRTFIIALLQGVPLNLSKDKPKKNAEPAANRMVSGFSRNDGGRFSLRQPRSHASSAYSNHASHAKPSSGLSSGQRASSRDELRANVKQQVSARNIVSADARSRLHNNKVASDNEQVRASPASLYALRHSANSPLQRSSSFGVGGKKMQNYSHREASDRLMRGLPTSRTALEQRIFSAHNASKQQGYESPRLQPTVNLPAGDRSDVMSTSMTEKVGRSSPYSSVESPLSTPVRTPKSRELTALDTLVITAILQLSHKLRVKMRECLQHERLKFEDNSETRLLIDEILPQLNTVEARLQDGSETGSSKDLSNILKNLKKVEQSIDGE